MIDIALLSFFFFTLRLGEENVSLFSICLLLILKSNSLSIKVNEKAKKKGDIDGVRFSFKLVGFNK